MNRIHIDKPRIGIRWTVGDVSDSGFEALQLSIWGLWKLFGNAASYTVCVNTIPVALAQERIGEVPHIRWHQVDETIPEFLKKALDNGMAEGAAWKFLPLRLYSEMHELSLDNDFILWEIPESISEWMKCRNRCLMGSDAKACFGQFAGLCGPEPRNAGIRGFPPHFNLEAALRNVLQLCPVTLQSETDEQGLQVLALSQIGDVIPVPLEDVSICSAFPMHSLNVGRCGAHFAGLNMKQSPWMLDGKPITVAIQANWQHHKPLILAKLRLSESERPPQNPL